MRRGAFALGLFLATSIPAVSQQPSQLDLVRALRSNGLVDLAVQRLEELRSKPGKLTAEEVKLVPLELARIRLEEASRESDDSRRATLIGQARASFEEFIRANPTHPMAAQANVEIARLFALQAKGQLSRANRVENRDAKAAEFSRARPDFTTAYNRYQGAITNLDNRLRALDAKDPLATELRRSKAQAELDAAVLLYEIGLSFIGDDETRQKGEAIDKAQKAFDKVAASYANTRIGHLANIWALQCRFVNGEAAKVVPAMNDFINLNRNNRDAADAVRLASFFGIEHVFEGETGKDTTPAARLVRTEQAAQRWLQTYPEAKNTPEGLGARYRRALMKETQAFLPGGVIFQEPPKAKTTPKTKEKGKEPAKAKEPAPVARKIIGISPQARQLLEDANKIYKDIADTDNEYSDRAQRRRLMNQLVILEADGRGGDPTLKAINTLEQGYLAAQVQQARIYELGKSGKSEAEQDKEEKRRVDNAVAYLERGLQRVTPKDSPRDVFDAQMLLVNFLSKQGRAVEAAVLGEGLARGNPRMPKASTAAALAIFAYNSALARLMESPAKSDEAEAADVRRIIALSEYADKTWPNDGPTDAIRHVLAFYQGKNDHELAWKTYSKIGSGYSDVYQARREMAAAMFYMLKPADGGASGKYRDELAANLTKHAQSFRSTMSMLENLPEPPASAAPGTIDSWAGAKTMQAQLYYMASDYEKVDAVVKATVEALKKFPTADDKRKDFIDAKKKDDMGYTIRGLKYNALQGRAAEYIRAKEFAKVGETLGAELEALKKELKEPPPAEESPGFVRLRAAQRGFLIAAMSALVQNKQADQATELLDALQSSGGTLEQSVATMRALNFAIEGQIDSLTREGKKSDADELAKSYADFLDKIRGEDTAKLPNGVVTFLGQGYSAVHQHARAAALFEQLIKKPFEPSAKATPEEKKDQEAKHAAFIRQLEYMQARAYRLAGANGGGKPEFDKATALMQKIVGDPLKKGPRGWGYSNMAVRKEYNLLLEDQNYYGPAGNNWVRLTAEFAPPGNAAPTPIKFLGQREAFVSFGKTADEALLATISVPGAVSTFVDIGFKQVYPVVAETRNRQRQAYFDLFFEQYRCSARGWTTPAVVAKFKGGQEQINLKLHNIAQKLFDMLTRNDDVPPEVREKVQDFLNEDRYKVIKKKFDELLATVPKT